MGLDINNRNNSTNGANGAGAGAGAVVVDKAVATKPNNMDAVPSLVKQINAGVDALGTGSDEARHALLVKARNLMQALETPRETMIKHCWAQVSITTTFKERGKPSILTDFGKITDRRNGWLDYRR